MYSVHNPLEAGVGDPAILSHSRLLASLALLREPATWIRQVDESITIDRSELVRSVCVQLEIPSSDLSDQPLLADPPGAAPTFFVPILTPRKDTLPDLRDIVCDRSEQSYAMATHHEHVAISRALIRARLFQTWLPLLINTLQYRVSQEENREISVEEVAVEVAKLQSIADRLCEIPELGPDSAMTVVQQIFREESVPSLSERPGVHAIRAIRSALRPARDENRLYLLCCLLAERYLKVLRVPHADLGERLQVEYVCRQGYRDERPVENRSWLDRKQDPVRELLGGRPSHLRFPLPLARRTPHYTFRFRAPSNYFIRSADFVRRGGDHRRERLRRSLYAPTPDGRLQPSVAKELGGQTEAFLMLGNGDRSPDQLDAALICYELPPGSTAFSAIVALLVTVIAATTYLILRNSAVSNAHDVPALLVALASSSGVVATPFLPKSDLYAAPLLSRVTLLAVGVTGNLFALWIVLRSARVTASGWVGDVVRFVQIHGGVILLAVMTVVTAVGFRRLWRLCIRYLRARGVYVPVTAREGFVNIVLRRHGGGANAERR